MSGKIHVLHENDEWVVPLRAALEARELPFEMWHLAEGSLDLTQAPPDGVFYNRMSASSHTRGHRYAPELTAGVLAWLEAAGRRVVNDSRALALEINKAAQYARLGAAGIPTPRTIAAVGADQVLAAAEAFAPGPVILKPNRGGKGLGVRLFESVQELHAFVNSEAFLDEAPIDGVWLLQEYIYAPDRLITRVEFVGGRFLYAVQVDVSGGFELCPADVCEIPSEAQRTRPPFEIVDGFEPVLIAKAEAFLAGNGIEVAGIEFIDDGAGRVLAYDINTNTNYNSAAEARADRSGMGAIADFLGGRLKEQAAAQAA